MLPWCQCAEWSLSLCSWPLPGDACTGFPACMARPSAPGEIQEASSTSWVLPGWWFIFTFPTKMIFENICVNGKLQLMVLSKMIQMPEVDLDVTSIIQADEPTASASSTVGWNSVFGRDYRALKDILINTNSASTLLPSPPHPSPSLPSPLLLVLYWLLRYHYRVLSTFHTYSTRACQKIVLSALVSRRKNSPVVNQLGLTLIPENVLKTQMKFRVPVMYPIEGEGKIDNFWFSLFDQKHNAIDVTLIDSWVERAIFQLEEGSPWVLLHEFSFRKERLACWAWTDCGRNCAVVCAPADGRLCSVMVQPMWESGWGPVKNWHF